MLIDSDVQKHVRNGIDHSLNDKESLYPKFINPVSGQTFPLSPYYRRRFETLEDAYIFFERNPDSETNGFKYTEDRDPLEYEQKLQQNAKVFSKINKRTQNDDFINENTTNQIQEFSDENQETDFVYRYDIYNDEFSGASDFEDLPDV